LPGSASDPLSQSPDVSPEDPVVGCVGKVITATRGVDGPGEVLVRVRGGTEAYLAWSEEPLARDTSVIVFNSRGERTVDVMQFDSDP
jgi:hypothetical protein